MEGRIHSVTGPKAKARAISTYVKRHPFVREFVSDPLSISSEIARKMTKVNLYFFRPDAILYLNNEAGFGTRWKLEVEGGRASGLAGEPLL